MALAKVPRNKLNAFSPEFDQNIMNLALSALANASVVDRFPDELCYHIQDRDLNIVAAQTVVAMGVNLEDYQFFIKIPSRSSLIPDTITGSSFEDENGSVIERTRETRAMVYGREIHEGADGGLYIEASDGVKFFTLSSLDRSGLTLVDAETVRKLINGDTQDPI